MNPPRWFWAILAACFVAVSAALTWRLVRPVHPAGDSWQWTGSGTAFNARTATICGGASCFDVRTGKAVYPTPCPQIRQDSSSSHLDYLIAKKECAQPGAPSN